jgi:hypothetical protein
VTILDCVQIDILHSALLRTSLSPLSRLWLNAFVLILRLSVLFPDIGLTLVIHPLVQSRTSHPFPFCFGHSTLQPFLCWFLLGICPEVVYNSFTPLDLFYLVFLFLDIHLDLVPTLRIYFWMSSRSPDITSGLSHATSGSPIGTFIRVALPIEFNWTLLDVLWTSFWNLGHVLG